MIHLISVEKIICYMLLLKINIIFHEGREDVLDVGFFILGALNSVQKSP